VGAVEAVGFSLGPEPQAVASITAEGNKATELNAHATLKADNMKHDENGQVHTLHSIGVRSCLQAIEDGRNVQPTPESEKTWWSMHCSLMTI
jgi:hypothetical protein